MLLHNCVSKTVNWVVTLFSAFRGAHLLLVVNWVVTLFSAFRGAHHLFIAVRPNYSAVSGSLIDCTTNPLLP